MLVAQQAAQLAEVEVGREQELLAVSGFLEVLAALLVEVGQELPADSGSSEEQVELEAGWEV